MALGQGVLTDTHIILRLVLATALSAAFLNGEEYDASNNVCSEGVPEFSGAS